MWVGGAWGRVFLQPLPPCPPPDVDECAWEADACREGQRCVNLLGSYRCLPNCRPGFRVATDGAGCEGDRGRVPGCPDSRGPSGCQGSAEGVLCVTGTLGLRGNWNSLGRRSRVRPGRKPELGSGGLSPDPAWLLVT